MNETFILVSLAVLALIVVIAVAAAAWVAIWTNRKLRADPDFEALQARHPEGYWMGIGVALGVALGLPLGFAINAAMGDAGSGRPLALQWVSPSALRSGRPWSSGTRVRPAR